MASSPPRPRADASDIEPGIARVLNRRAACKTAEPYRARSVDEVAVALNRFLAEVEPRARPSITVALSS